MNLSRSDSRCLALILTRPDSDDEESNSDSGASIRSFAQENFLKKYPKEEVNRKLKSFIGVTPIMKDEQITDVLSCYTHDNSHEVKLKFLRSLQKLAKKEFILISDIMAAITSHGVV